MSSLPSKVRSLLKKSDKKQVKFVLFRLPQNMEVSDLNGAKLDLTDLKLTSIQGNMAAIPDLHMDAERASACPLIPEEDGSFRCGPPFAASIQIVKQAVPSKRVIAQPQPLIKKEKKLKKIKSEL
jgi:hypothetical protein